ncbi:MAG: hypothetical protein ABIP42_07005 [Planctomycetota bacterium]
MDREQQRAAAREQAAFTAQPAKVPLQAWGGDIFIRRITVAEALASRERASSEDPRALAGLLARRICDEQGVLTFDADSPEDVELLLGQGIAWLVELNAAVAEVDAPGKPSATSASS